MGLLLQPCVWLFLWICVGICKSVPVSNHEEMVQSNDALTLVAIPAVLKELKDVHLYTESANLLFIMPDLPKPPSAGILACTNYDGKNEKWCQYEHETSKLNFESAKLLNIMDAMFTFNGVGSRNSTSYNVSRNELSDEDRAIAEKAGITWYSHFDKVMKDRSITSATRLRIVKRSLIALAAYAGKQVVRHLIMRNGALKAFLIQKRARLPKALQVFLDLPKKLSEFAFESKKSETVVTLANQNVDGHIWHDNHAAGPTYLQKEDYKWTSFYASQTIYKTAELLNYNVLMQGHLTSMTSCRAGNVPLLFVPPSVLKPRYEELAKTIPEDQELVIKDHLEFYDRELGQCSIDDDGGVVTVKTLLKPKGAVYKLFKFQAIAFAWRNSTCDFDIPGSYIIKDETNGDMFPISNTDEESCEPLTTRMCQLPEATSANIPKQYCLQSFFEGGTASEIKRACPVTCRSGNSVTSTQLSEDVVAIAHLPRQGASVTCDTGYTKEITHTLRDGALKFTLGCGCKVLYKGRTVAKSMRTVCPEKFIPLIMEYLLPIHLSHQDEFVPNVVEGVTGIKFKTYEDVIDEDWTPNMSKNDNDNWIENYLMPVLFLLFALINWCCTSFMCYRTRIGICGFLNPAMIPSVGAAPMSKVCGTSAEVYYLLGAILILLILVAIPTWISFCCKKCTKTCNRIVENKAEELIMRKRQALENSDQEDN